MLARPVLGHFPGAARNPNDLAERTWPFQTQQAPQPTPSVNPKLYPPLDEVSLTLTLAPGFRSRDLVSQTFQVLSVRAMFTPLELWPTAKYN